VHREVLAPPRDKNPLTAPTVRGQKTLHESIDYAKLTASQQARWDAGLYGSIELKKIKTNYYFYLRWTDPETGAKRSSYLAKEWDKAIAKLQKLIAPD
jgi:phage repressor protein C with HTH and peptisase S24 domain